MGDFSFRDQFAINLYKINKISISAISQQKKNTHALNWILMMGVD